LAGYGQPANGHAHVSDSGGNADTLLSAGLAQGSLSGPVAKVL